MKRLHEKLYKLYNMSEFLKLFIVYCLLFYFLNDILPQSKDMSEIILRSILYGVSAGIFCGIYMKPKYKDKKRDSSYSDE